MAFSDGSVCVTGRCTASYADVGVNAALVIRAHPFRRAVVVDKPLVEAIFVSEHPPAYVPRLSSEEGSAKVSSR